MPYHVPTLLWTRRYKVCRWIDCLHGMWARSCSRVWVAERWGRMAQDGYRMFFGDRMWYDVIWCHRLLWAKFMWWLNMAASKFHAFTVCFSSRLYPPIFIPPWQGVWNHSLAGPNHPALQFHLSMHIATAWLQAVPMMVSRAVFPGHLFWEWSPFCCCAFFFFCS